MVSQADDYYTLQADLNEARSEIRRHHELIKKLKEGIDLLYEWARDGQRDYWRVDYGESGDDPTFFEVENFMVWYWKNVG